MSLWFLCFSSCNGRHYASHIPANRKCHNEMLAENMQKYVFKLTLNNACIKESILCYLLCLILRNYARPSTLTIEFANTQIFSTHLNISPSSESRHIRHLNNLRY